MTNLSFTEVEGYERSNGRTGRTEFVTGHTRTIGINGKPLPRGYFSKTARAQRERFWGTLKKARSGDTEAIAKCEVLGIYWQPLG